MQQKLWLCWILPQASSMNSISFEPYISPRGRYFYSLHFRDDDTET